MGDLFSSFNPETSVVITFGGNWAAAIAIVFLIPQGYWVMKSQYSSILTSVYGALLAELRAVLGSYMSPGGMLIFVSFFSLILSVNFLGLMPYVFTPSSHLSFTLSLALPLWLGKIIFSFVKQLEHNLAHLVPEGTPAGLMPLMVIIESVSLVIRPGTLAVRLAANMVAGHLLLVLLGGQGAGLGGLLLGGLLFSLCLLVTLECAVACIQAYVFTILSSLYLSEHNSKVVSLSGV